LGYIRFELNSNQLDTICFIVDVKTEIPLSLRIYNINQEGDVLFYIMSNIPIVNKGTFSISNTIPSDAVKILLDMDNGAFDETKNYFTDNWRLFIQ